MKSISWWETLLIIAGSSVVLGGTVLLIYCILYRRKKRLAQIFDDDDACLTAKRSATTKTTPDLDNLSKQDSTSVEEASIEGVDETGDGNKQNHNAHQNVPHPIPPPAEQGSEGAAQSNGENVLHTADSLLTPSPISPMTDFATPVKRQSTALKKKRTTEAKGKNRRVATSVH